MNDPVLRVIIARQALIDEGYSKGILLSGAAHALTFVAVLLLALLTPAPKVINVVDGFAVPLPKGGGVPREASPIEAPSEAEPPPPAEAPKAAVRPPAPAKLIQPEVAIPKKGLAPVDLKRSVRDLKKPESREIATEKITAPEPRSAPSSTPVAGIATTGLDFTAQTPGVADGVIGPTGPLSFYLTAVKIKIWAVWARQIRSDFPGSVKIAFTIHRDGSVDGVEVLESSGSVALDRLAERAVISPQLGPLPSAYEKETLVVHANFKPVS